MTEDILARKIDTFEVKDLAPYMVELVGEMASQTKKVEDAAKDAQQANNIYTDALNRLNKLQARLDATIVRMKEHSAAGSDWTLKPRRVEPSSDGHANAPMGAAPEVQMRRETKSVRELLEDTGLANPRPER